MRRVTGTVPKGGERRQLPRWLDKRLVTVQTLGSEYPGMTGDLSTGGMRVGLPCDPARVGQELEICVAFAQDLLTVDCQLVYSRKRPWGTVVGVRHAPGQDVFRRFLSRRYGEPENREAPLAPKEPLWVTRRALAELAGVVQAQRDEVSTEERRAGWRLRRRWA